MLCCTNLKTEFFYLLQFMPIIKLLTMDFIGQFIYDNNNIKKNTNQIIFKILCNNKKF